MEDQFLDTSAAKLDTFDNFFEANGTRNIVFFYQEHVLPGKGEPAKRVFLANAGLDVLDGTCTFAVRISPRALTTSNMANEINFGAFQGSHDAASPKSLLHGLESMITDVIEPALHVNDNWGKLHADDSQKDEFYDALERFRASLTEADHAVTGRVKLAAYTPPEGANPMHLEAVKTPADMTRVSQDTKAVEQLEVLLQTWCQQLTVAIAESEQMRREADDVGPRAELEHWKNQTAKFNGILDQVKAPGCQKVIAILVQAKSRFLAEWRQKDARITESANESKENVKYLNALDRCCGPLYKESPVAMMESVPNLMGVVGMIHSISPYYNTSERMTALCVKITNQMITACKEYIYEKDNRLWKQDVATILKRLAEVTPI